MMVNVMGGRGEILSPLTMLSTFLMDVNNMSISVDLNILM